MCHEVGDVGDGGRCGARTTGPGSPRRCAGPARPVRARHGEVVVGGVHPGLGDRRDVGLDLWRLAAGPACARARVWRNRSGRAAAPGGRRRRPGRARLGRRPRRRTLVAALEATPGLGDAGPPATSRWSGRPSERAAHQPAPRLARVSVVSWRRKRSSSSWRATSSSRAAIRAWARASSRRPARPLVRPKVELAQPPSLVPVGR